MLRLLFYYILYLVLNGGLEVIVLVLDVIDLVDDLGALDVLALLEVLQSADSHQPPHPEQHVVQDQFTCFIRHDLIQSLHHLLALFNL